MAGKDVLARPEIVDDGDQIERLLAVMTAANPMVGRQVRVPGHPLAPRPNRNTRRR
jgi:hypothetical protein